MMVSFKPIWSAPPTLRVLRREGRLPRNGWAEPSDPRKSRLLGTPRNF
jgi:hypothetical protein